ncbi:MAG: hypothetical protein IIW20_00655 [Clostridia bacterium]|nr:hypothetical protein [Clostridia bacterium]
MQRKLDINESVGTPVISFKRSIGSFISNMGILIAAFTLLCAFAVFFMDISLSSFATVDFSLSFIILLFCAYTIYFSMADTGMRVAMSDKGYKKAREEYDALKSELQKSGRLEGLGEFCHEYAKNELVSARKNILLGAGISYDKFCEEYQHKEKSALPKSLSKRERRAIIRANRLSPVRLSPDMLLFLDDGASERRALHRNPKKIRLFSSAKALISTTMTSFFAVSIVCSVIEEPTFAILTECLIKLFTLVFNGSKGFLMGYNNITVDTTSYLFDCTDLLYRFSSHEKAKASKEDEQIESPDE